MPPSVVYHYTSFAAFQSIVHNRQLWATNLRYLNDWTEAIHAYDLCEEYVTKYFEDEKFVPSSLLKKWLGSEFINDMALTACVVSFSEEADSLSQWRAYASGGAGVCIGFYSDLFTRLINCHQQSSEKFGQCIYVEHKKQEFVRNILAAPLKALLSTFNTDASSEEKATRVSEVTVPIILNAPMLKHQAFSSEKEWRFVRYAIEQTRGPFSATPWQFRPSGSSLLPYTVLDLSESKDTPFELAEIVIGPNPHPASALRAVKMFLEQEGVRCEKVRCSDAPFRSW